MGEHFRYVVVGRGMTGAAAARHLACDEDTVLLVGPGEPEDKATHDGVFASHYDEGRITRTLDPDLTWGRLAARSMARYAAIEAESGIPFHTGTGSLYVASDAERLGKIEAVAAAEGASAERLAAAALRARFPYFSFPAACEGIFEAGPAGHISPRKFVAAETRLADRAGATVMDATVSTVREEGGRAVVTFDEGTVVTADAVLVAVGGYSIVDGLLPDPLRLEVYGRTVVFFEVDAAEAARYAGMPSLIAKVRAPDDEIYLLPPIAYPDGGVRLKIGGEPDDYRLDDRYALGEWFRSNGRPEAIGHLIRAMKRRVPGLNAARFSAAACVTTYTPSGHPAIGWAGKRIAVMTGGCGAAAKSADEIGRLGSVLLREGTIHGEGYASTFPVEFS